MYSINIEFLVSNSPPIGAENTFGNEVKIECWKVE